jgi:hypothetical protein
MQGNRPDDLMPVSPIVSYLLRLQQPGAELFA